jgi:hypothetical protein
MADARVPMSAAMGAFGITATVTRPYPDETPVTTTIFWISPLIDEVPVGGEFQRKARRRVAVMDRDDVSTCPRGTLIAAAERDGEDAQTWRVDSLESEDVDQLRVLVVLDE